MVRRALVATAVCSTLAVARPAAADGLYFTEGFGGSTYRDELPDAIGADSGIHLRAAFGWRSGHLAVELWGRGEIPIGHNFSYDKRTFDASPGMFGLDLKVIQPLSAHWSTYVRGGLSMMRLGGTDYAGRGLGATAGIQVAGKVRALGYLAWPLFFIGRGPRVHSALWFEANTSFHRLHASDGPSIDAKLTGWTLGFSVGQDF